MSGNYDHAITALKPQLFRQQFRDLHRVRGGTLSQVIAHTPKRDPIRRANVLANAPDEHFIPAIAIQRHRVFLFLQVVNHNDPRKLRNNSRACSTLSGFSVSTKILSLWQLLTGTRIAVGQT